MKKLSKVLVFVLTVALGLGACFAFTGCNDNDNQTGVSNVDLKVFTMFGVGDDHNGAYAANVDKFKAANPNVRIEDVSLTGATNDYDTQLLSMFATADTSPDVLYTFAPGRNAAFTDQLATIDQVKAKYPGYTLNVNMSYAPDAYTIPMKGITEGIQYDPQRYADADFASFDAFVAACKRENAKSDAFDSATMKSGAKVADPIGEINYWANMILLQKMGDKVADSGAVNKAWIEANKTALASTIDYIKTVYNEIGFSKNVSTNYGDEKAAMWAGGRSLTVDGSWNCLGFYGAEYGNKAIVNDNDATKGIKVRNIVTDNAKTYVLAGFTHGWMINKKCLDDPAKLSAAVKFVRSQLDGVQEYATSTGGFYSMDVMSSPDQFKMTTDFGDLMKTANSKMVTPIDDKFELVAAKDAFFNGIKNMLADASGYNGTKIVNDMIEAYNN